MKNYFIGSRVSEDEFKTVSLIGKREGLSLSETLRWLIHSEATRHNLCVGEMLFYESLPAPTAAELPNVDLSVADPIIEEATDG